MTDDEMFIDQIEFKLRAAKKDYETAKALFERVKDTDIKQLRKEATWAVDLGEEAVEYLRIALAEGRRTRKAEKFDAVGTTCHQGCGENSERVVAALEDGK